MLDQCQACSTRQRELGTIVTALAIFPLVVAFAADPGPAGPTAPEDQPSTLQRAAVHARTRDRRGR